MRFSVDLLNTLLIIVSLILAVYFPFELFLLVYAVLGPLHYLTEINWIKDKNYFLSNKNWVYIASALALLVTIPIIIKLIWPVSSENLVLGFFRQEFVKITNGFILLALVIACSYLIFSDYRIRFCTIALAIIFAVLAKDLSVYNIWIGILLPTIIHVYLFTFFFMWYGNLKKNNSIGYINIFLIALIPFIIMFLSLDESTYQFSNEVKDIIIENRFFVLNTTIANLLGLSDGSSFFFNEVIDLKIQIMIAFAYTYHYLNWFSKTTVIGWHKNLTSKKSVLILVIWFFSLFLYAYDYKIGLTFLLVLSLMHVFLEFPLNVISIRGIYNNLSARLK